MNQRKCFKCGATQFFGNEGNEQCPQNCSHCGNEINPDFIPLEDMPRSDGPTMMEFVDQGNKAIDYPPKGFKERPWSITDMQRLDELSETENKYNDIPSKDKED